MPTYVYACSSCGGTFEKEQRITESPLTECECGGKVRRLIQPAAIMFNGSGFHINDYASTSAPVEAAPAPAAADCTGNPSSCGCSAPSSNE